MQREHPLLFDRIETSNCRRRLRRLRRDNAIPRRSRRRAAKERSDKRRADRRDAATRPTLRRLVPQRFQFRAVRLPNLRQIRRFKRSFERGALVVRSEKTGRRDAVFRFALAPASVERRRLERRLRRRAASLAPFELASRRSQRVEQNVRRLRSVARFFLDHSPNQRDQRRRRVGAKFLDRPRSLVQVLENNGQRRVADKRRDAGQHSIRDDSERINIGTRIDFSAARLFRTHIERRSHREPGSSQRRGGRADVSVEPRQAEVDDLNRSVRVEQNVLRFDVAMNDARVRRPLERRRDLFERGKRLRNRRSSAAPQKPLQTHSVDKLLRDKAIRFFLRAAPPKRPLFFLFRAAVRIVRRVADKGFDVEIAPRRSAERRDADFVNANDIRVFQPRRRSRLLQEPLQIRFVARQFVLQDFQRDRTPQRKLRRQKDVGRRAAADAPFDSITAERSSAKLFATVVRAAVGRRSFDHFGFPPLSFFGRSRSNALSFFPFYYTAVERLFNGAARTTRPLIY